MIQGAVAMLTQLHVGCCGMPLLLSSLQMTNTAASPTQTLPYILAPITAMGLTFYESWQAKSCTSLHHSHHHENTNKSVRNKTLMAWGLTALMTASGFSAKDNHLKNQSAQGWSDNEKAILYAVKPDQVGLRFFIGDIRKNDRRKANAVEISFTQAVCEGAGIVFSKNVKSVSGRLGLNATSAIMMTKMPKPENVYEKLSKTFTEMIAFNNRRNLDFRTVKNNL